MVAVVVYIIDDDWIVSLFRDYCESSLVRDLFLLCLIRAETNVSTRDCSFCEARSQKDASCWLLSRVHAAEVRAGIPRNPWGTSLKQYLKCHGTILNKAQSAPAILSNVPLLLFDLQMGTIDPEFTE